MTDPAMIVLKRTPNGIKLLPLVSITGDRGRRMERHHPQAARVGYVMNLLMDVIRPDVRAGLRPTLGEAWARLVKLYGADYLTDVTLLPSVGTTPPRLLFKASR